MSNRVRLGIIGCGNIMRLFHLPQYPRIPEVQVTSIYDIDGSRAQGAAELLDQFWAQEAEVAPGNLDAVGHLPFDDAQAFLDEFQVFHAELRVSA